MERLRPETLTGATPLNNGEAVERKDRRETLFSMSAVLHESGLETEQPDEYAAVKEKLGEMHGYTDEQLQTMNEQYPLTATEANVTHAIGEGDLQRARKLLDMDTAVFNQ